MHFRTEEEWELRDPILRSLQGTGARMYPCVEVDLNGPLWHLDLLFTWPEKITCWRRFILTSIEQVVATIAEHGGQCRLHFQDARAERSPYVIEHVDVLAEGICKAGRAAFIVRLPNRKFVLPDRSISEASIRNVRDLFVAKKFPVERVV